MRARVALLLALGLAACPVIPSPKLSEVATFDVLVTGVFQRVGVDRKPLAVVSPCAARYGSQDLVPADVKGTVACRYVIPRAEIEIDIAARALNRQGEQVADFNQPVSFRVLPGDLSGDYRNRWAFADHGAVTATVKAIHQYGKVRVWVENGPPKPIYDAGVQVGGVADLPPSTAIFTYASGLSPEIAFDDQTLQSLQLPDGFDNRSSPFVGEFVAVGKNPESGERLLQSCENDPRRDGQQSVMVVTGIDPTGFFVTDITACRLVEWTKDSAGATQVRTPEPPESCLVATDAGLVAIEDTDAGVGACNVSQRRCVKRADCPGYLPGTFASMFVYNYNYPDGLNEGDLLFTLSGAVQEFTSTTQITFPSWSIAESVRTLPPDQWEKWLRFAPPIDITERTCGMDNAASPFLTDQLCGHNKRNLKMESLESGLVRLRNVHFPQTFKNCDFNADQSVPFFCEQTDPQGAWFWGSCAFGEVEPENDRLERECTQSCVLGTLDYDATRCSERSTYAGFGQYVVEMNAPGPADAGFDESLPNRTVRVAVVWPDGGGLASDGGLPAVTVDSPDAGAWYTSGQAVSLRGHATDFASRPLRGTSLIWSNGTTLGSGDVLSVSTLPVGEHRVVLTSTDITGHTGYASTILTVAAAGANRPPVVTLQSPANGASLPPGTTTLRGSATDPEDGALTGAALTWTASDGGVLGTGSPLDVTLPLGVHALTLTATDGPGLSTRATVSVAVNAAGNQPPVATLARPRPITVFEGMAVELAGSATDPEDGALTGTSLSWTSSLDGPLGTGGALSIAGMTVGDHLVSFIAVDSAGNHAVATLPVHVLPPDEAPQVTIDSPADGTVISARSTSRTTVQVSGTATDAEDGPLSGTKLLWRSSIDGVLGSGSPFGAPLSPGVHLLTLTATDSGGRSATASVKVTVVVAGRVDGYGPGADATILCDVPAHLHYVADRAATLTDPLQPANTPLRHHFGSTESEVSLLSDGLTGTCAVAYDIRSRINLLTRDALPELQIDCTESDPNAQRATACKALHTLSFDVVGHLRHVQPARPRWMVIPRSPDDVCCHPAGGLECPTPVKPCK